MSREQEIRESAYGLYCYRKCRPWIQGDAKSDWFEAERIWDCTHIMPPFNNNNGMHERILDSELDDLIDKDI